MSKIDKEYVPSGRFSSRFEGEEQRQQKIDLSSILTEPVRLDVYKNDVVVVRQLQRPMNNDGKKGGNKKKITKLSKRSLGRLAFVASNTDVQFGVMVTLTYPMEFETRGKVVKKHLQRMLKMLVRRFDCKHLWFMEFQKRGAPHFHVLLSINEYKLFDIRWLAKSWYKIVNSGDIKHILAGVRIAKIRKKDGAMRYIVSYATKPEQKIVPWFYTDCGRFFGYSKGVAPTCKGSISVMSEEDMISKLGTWEYKDKIVGKFVSVLYNAAKFTVLEDGKNDSIDCNGFDIK